MPKSHTVVPPKSKITRLTDHSVIIASLLMKFTMNDGGRADAGYRSSKHDCVARAIAITTGRPYDEIRQYLSSHSSDGPGINTRRKWFHQYMRDLGFAWHPTMGIGTGCRVHLREDELPSGKLVVMVSRHAVAVIDHVIHDVWNPARGGNRCVYGYWKLG